LPKKFFPNKTKCGLRPLLFPAFIDLRRKLVVYFLRYRIPKDALAELNLAGRGVTYYYALAENIFHFIAFSIEISAIFRYA
jgi:hypothetical protein